MASEFLNDEELNEVSGGVSEDGKYLYAFEVGDWVYAREDKTVIHQVYNRPAHTNSSVYLVDVQVSRHGAQPTYGRVQARKLMQCYHQFGGKLKNY